VGEMKFCRFWPF